MAEAQVSSPPDRFAFGENWREFAESVDEARIAEAERSLTDMLGPGALEGRTFLDIGSGSGLFSLAAVRLGASRVHSFDYDPASVATTQSVRARFAPDAEHWTVERGDATDPGYVGGLGAFDVVYSWGVLHHTGAMWRGIELATSAVAPGGALFIAIYNDQGQSSKVWRVIKRSYVELPALRPLLLLVGALWIELGTLYGSVSGRDPFAYLKAFRQSRGRGMSRWHDLKDWVGGYPFEVAKPDEIFDFCRERGFALARLNTMAGGIGCNEFVFVRDRG